MSNTATIQLGQTVYGADINWDTGVMTVTHGISSGKVTGIRDSYSNIDYGYVPKAADSKEYGQYSQFDTISSMFERGAGDAAGWDDANKVNKFFMQPSNDYYWIGFPKGTSLATMQSITEDNQICYKLAEPQTIQLTPAQLELLKGYNRVSIESGSIELGYTANIQAEVDVLETTKADNADVVDYIENGNTASRAYTANQFMLWKGDLYKVTTSIASGATITAGTNVSKTTIGAVLTALLNS